MRMRLLAAVFAAVGTLGPASADAISDFYSTHPITFVVGFPPSGGYDASARVLAAHIRKHRTFQVA